MALIFRNAIYGKPILGRNEKFVPDQGSNKANMLIGKSFFAFQSLPCS